MDKDEAVRQHREGADLNSLESEIEKMTPGKIKHVLEQLPGHLKVSRKNGEPLRKVGDPGGN